MSFFGANGSLHLSTEQSVYFVRPQSAVSRQLEPPSNETVLCGTLKLNLPKARRLSQISVKFTTAMKVLAGNVRVRSHTLFEKELLISANDKIFPAGASLFTFAFELPSTLAPSDTTSYASVRSILKATVKGTGYASDLTAALEVNVVADATHPGDLPDGVDVRVEALSNELGPYAVDTISNLLSVAGLITCRLTFANPAFPNHITDIRASVEQISLLNDKREVLTCTDRLPLAQFSSSDSQQVYKCPAGSQVPARLPTIIAPWPNPAKFQRVTDSPLCRVTPGEEASVRFLVRLPSHDRLRPSTPEGTKTGLNISHKFILQVNYTTSTGNSKTITITRPVSIASCSCTSTALSLPPYASCDPLKGKVIKASHLPCSCEMSLAQTLQISGDLDQVWNANRHSSSRSSVKGLEEYVHTVGQDLVV